MNAEIYRTLAAIREEPQVVIDVVDRFDTALLACTDGWTRGDNMVILPDNLPILFGKGVVELFKKALAEKAGLPIDLTPMESANSSHTLVKMPKNNRLSLRVQSSAPSVQAPSSDRTAIDMDALAAALKKAPRPMNCWIIFRDAMHKQLKAQYPSLTVQEISTRCSEIWHSLAPEGKKPWQAAAQSAKEEHLRQHPDYKYSPRKPGEKKKRQSRKAKRASAAATVPEVLNFQLAPNLASALPSSTYELAPSVSDITANVRNDFTDDLTQLFEPANVFEVFAQDSVYADLTYDSESFRHGRLDEEFGMDFDMNANFALLDDEAFAFRDGADGDAILPAFFQDTY
uniref:MAT1 n=1 Tax=Alternaria brassicicola TaxID=29001 RepID=D5L2R6_ALTBR|nr:MAT1 [Alternaria brassicicola]ADE44120.1 MAT1 [Alternaria brassicicola]BAJ10498.1 mating type protein MAT1-2-1 [Alternaria brassicicola]BAJ10499.1 mating type protein MAT1-2-1 [Alternaria brassicicola]